MKKVIFSMCLAALAIGCAKTEVQFEETDLISFAPVTHNATKAAVQSGAPGCNLLVSANAGTAGAEASTYEDLYFDEVTFSGTTEYTAEGYFWPNVKHLSFAGITQSAGISPNNVAIDVNDNTITVTNYPQQEVETPNNDLMWFGQTAPAGKTTNAIPVTLNHACSWIVLNFKGDGTTANSTRPWKITNVTINGLSANETATLTDVAVWSETQANKTKSLVIYNDPHEVGTGINTTFSPNNQNIIVIPQTPPTTLSVTYNYVSQFGTDGTTESDDIVIEETATVDLTYATETINEEEVSKKWEAGYKYTYDITITATGIKIAPSASTWIDYDADGDGGNEDNIQGTI